MESVSLAPGIYEALLDDGLRGVLDRHPELRSVFGKLDPEEEPSRLAAFVSKVLEQALRLESDSATRFQVCNELLHRLCQQATHSFLSQRRLVEVEKSLLLEVTPPAYNLGGIPRPETSLVESSLFTGSPSDPQLVHELQLEMRSADSVDVLVSFIKWSGVRLLISALEELTTRGGQLRIITTSYMGASDPEAIEWLARLPNTSVRISYDIARTRLHAKAYHFRRGTGFSTAYIGSANMSHAAMTSGLEWNLKVTSQDLPHILEKFSAEFETYWNSRDFALFNPDEPQMLRDAIIHARTRSTAPQVFFDLKPHPFQERILDALAVERHVHGVWRNLIVAATGTGKTVVAAFDFKRFFEERQRQARLLFVAHRREILEQAAATFRGVLRIPDFGELLVGPHVAARREHLFCSIDMLQSRRLWEQVDRNFYDFIVVDEVHHGPSSSYRPVFDSFEPRILLGLTATPERMDGQSVAADFQNRFAAEIRLPEALEEKLLCPFHYFCVADPVALDSDRFWNKGKYDIQALEAIYTGAHMLAMQRLDTIVSSLTRYEPNLERVRGIGFCVSVRHAEFMAEKFNERGIKSALLVGETDSAERERVLSDFRAGQITFLFTRDVLNEGLDIPEINTVLFLRPTDSLTVFLQQLGRGLRHAEGKDSLTVLDFVGQVHRRYRMDRKLKALLPKHRFNIEREVELEFPHLPSGCSLQLDRLAKEYVLANIRANLRNLREQVTERLQTFEADTGERVSFGSFVRHHDYEPETLLRDCTWSEWKARARLVNPPDDPDADDVRAGLVRLAQVDGPRELRILGEVVAKLKAGAVEEALSMAGNDALRIHYRVWGKPGSAFGAPTAPESFLRLSRNKAFLEDALEVVAWSNDESRVGGESPKLPFACPFELHAHYGSDDIKAGLGKATMQSAGERGVGIFHFAEIKAYALLVTFQKTEREFSPSTMYADYPISRELMHWESQAPTAQNSKTGQNLIHHLDRGYTILVFARDVKRSPNGHAIPFTYLGPATCVSYQNERPIEVVWRLTHPMPAEMFEENRRGA
jgi:superfamily II DNA or RNA helicase